ncbi:MAG: hypothetical protein ACRC6N_11150 [Plesiomonas sp.]
MNEVAVLSSQSSSASLLADVQYLEPYGSGAINRKGKGIIKPGIYAGFIPSPGDNLAIKISSSAAEDSQGSASINVNKNQITVHQVKDVSVIVPRGTTSLIVLEANFEFGKVTDQVDSSSTLKAAQIIAISEAGGIAKNQIELCRVTVPDSATSITQTMIDTSHRKQQTIGIEMSSSLNSDSESVAANSKAVNDLRKLLLGDDAPKDLSTIAALAAALGGDNNFATTVAKAIKTINDVAKTALQQQQNGADIPDKERFLQNLGLGEAKFVTNRGSNVNGTWTIWSDGAIELHGINPSITNGLATVTYPIALPKVVRYFSIAERLALDSGTSVKQLHASMIIDNTVTTTGFMARCQMIDSMPSSNGFSWRVYCPNN